MIGFAVGLAFGALEFFLLTKLVPLITKGRKSALFILLGKVFVLALALTIGVLFLRSQLMMLGAGLAAALIVGSVVFYVKTAMGIKKHGTKLVDAPQSESEGEQEPLS